MLTLEKLKEMKPGTIFAKGTVSDNSVGINMTGSGNLLRWLAVRGVIHDWAIYCHWASRSFDWIRQSGDKVTSESNIRKLVPCNDEAFKMYRY